MSAFLLAAGHALREMDILTCATHAPITEAYVADAFHWVGTFTTYGNPRLRRVGLEENFFRVRWSPAEFRKFHASIPVGVWSIEDLTHARRWMESMLDQRGSEMDMSEFAVLVRDAAYSSGLALCRPDPARARVIVNTLEGLGYSPVVASRVRDLIGARIMNAAVEGKSEQAHIETIGYWLNGLEEANVGPEEMCEILEIFIQRGLGEFHHGHLAWTERLQRLGIPAGEFPRLLRSALGYERRTGATTRMLLAAHALNDPSLKKNLPAIEERLSRLKDLNAAWDRLMALLPGKSEDFGKWADFPVQYITTLGHAVVALPYGSLESLEKLLNAVVPFVLRNIGHKNVVGVLAPIMDNLEKGKFRIETLDRDTIVRCLDYFWSQIWMEAYDMHNVPAFVKALTATIDQTRRWHREGRLAAELKVKQGG